tara:strand:- start:1815 stop:2222 length:408 start_codon:yes stop_codon:yes gene_type:complete
MHKKRVLKESKATLEVAIAKSLSQGRLLPSELDELEGLTAHELMHEHNLDYLMAERVKVHALTERQRITYQAQQTWEPDSRESFGSFTRTHPIPESHIRNKIRNIIKETMTTETGLEDIMDMSGIDAQDLKNRKE